MPGLQSAYNFVIQKCNAQNVGYSQAYRQGQVVDGIQYYDCSSLMSAACYEGGFFTSNPWFTTRNMEYYLLQANFQKMAASVNWLPGDILWRSGHTEMVYQPAEGGGITMGAHTDGVPLADQVSINSYSTPASSWSYLYRYPSAPITLEWVKGNRYLSTDEMTNNAQIVASVMTSYGWTQSAIAGMLGNMQSESTINPGIWQSLTENVNLGYGLVQWTPSTKWTTWASQNGYDRDDGYGQLARIQYEVQQNIQWQHVTTTMDFYDFTQYTGTPEQAAILFEENYEQHAGAIQPDRQTQARHWYDTLDYTGGIIPTPGTRPKNKLPIWMYNIRRRLII